MYFTLNMHTHGYIVLLKSVITTIHMYISAYVYLCVDEEKALGFPRKDCCN